MINYQENKINFMVLQIVLWNTHLIASLIEMIKMYWEIIIKTFRHFQKQMGNLSKSKDQKVMESKT